MKILLATGIYPPQIGGVATYAKHLEEALIKEGHSVEILKFDFEYKLPTVIRHIFLGLRSLGPILKSDFVISLDFFSVGLPVVFWAKLFGKKSILRTGGDFLFESYLNRTGLLVTYDDFYDKHFDFLNFKEKIIRFLTRWVLQNVSNVVFSTDWQKEKFVKYYDLDVKKTSIIENFYGPKEVGLWSLPQKIFLSGGRGLSWKKCVLEQAFSKANKKDKNLILDNSVVSHDKFIEKIKSCYAVILTSISDISPNIILEAIRFSKPFIITKFNGLSRIKGISIEVDPRDEVDVLEKILWLSDESNYIIQKQKLENFSFTNTWQDIATGFIKIFNSSK